MLCSVMCARFHDEKCLRVDNADAAGYKSGDCVVHIACVCVLHAGFLLNTHTVVGSKVRLVTCVVEICICLC